MNRSWPSPRVWTAAAAGLALVGAVAGAWDRTVICDLIPGAYRDAVATFAAGARDVEVDARSGSAQIPLVLPGPADVWAGAGPHALRIRLAPRRPRGLLLSLQAADTHEQAPPRLVVAVNGATVDRVATRRGAGLPPPHGDRGVRSRYTVRIPAAALGEARDPHLALVNESGSWVTWERIRLAEADRTLAWAHLTYRGRLPPLGVAFLAAALGSLLLGSLGNATGASWLRRALRAIGPAAALILLGAASAMPPGAPAFAGVPRWLWLAAPWVLLACRTPGLIRGVRAATPGAAGIPDVAGAAPGRRAGRAISARSVLINGAVSSVALALSLLLGEAALRFVYRNVTSSADTNAYFHQRRHYEANSFGFREREFQPAKPTATYRIAVIGDSLAFGQGISSVDRFSSLLERHLAAEKRHGLAYEVLNFGAPGTDTVDHLQLLRALVLRIDPDFVLLQWYVNDFENGDRVNRPQPLPLLLPATLHATLLRSSALYALSQRQWVLLQEKVGLIDTYSTYMERRFRDPGSPDSMYAIERIEEFIRECKRKDTPVGLVLFPSVGPGLVGGAYEYGYLHDRVLAACAREQVACVDLRSTFARDPQYQTLWASPLDPHPSALAHRLAAEQLIDAFGQIWLGARGRVPSSGTTAYGPHDAASAPAGEPLGARTARRSASSTGFTR